MRETEFIRQNKEKWQELEKLRERGAKDPDRMTELFLQVNDDLSYARTFYPNRSISMYLNQLAIRSFRHLYRTRRRGNGFWRYWQQDLPLLMYRHRWAMILSLAIFILSLAIGVLSSIHEPEFARQILGERYVAMTEANIETGDPMAVYKDSQPFDMFLAITMNNILVSLRVFVMGVLAAIGTVALLLYNGIMIGTFQFFFIERGLFWESFLTIWQHGTLEISAIILAGGAGLVLGKGLLFPGSYSRMQAFLMTARDGFQLFLSTIPLFIIAAFIEGFFTRYTGAPEGVRLFLIIACALGVLLYYVVWPWWLHRQGMEAPPPVSQPPMTPPQWASNSIQSNGTLFTHAFYQLRPLVGLLLKRSLLTGLSGLFLLWGLYPEWYTYFDNTGPIWTGFEKWYHWVQLGRWPALLIPWLGMWMVMGYTLVTRHPLGLSTGTFSHRHWSWLAGCALLSTAPLLLGGGWSVATALLVWPVAMSLFAMCMVEPEAQRHWLQRGLWLMGGDVAKWSGLYLMLLLTAMIILLLATSPVQYFLIEVISWNVSNAPDMAAAWVGAIMALLVWVVNWVLIGLLQLGFTLQLFTLREIREAPGLIAKIKSLNG